MTPTTDKMQVSQQEQMTNLKSRLESLNSNIIQVEQFLSAKPNHKPTINRYNILCHSKSEILTKIRKLQIKQKLNPTP